MSKLTPSHFFHKSQMWHPVRLASINISWFSIIIWLRGIICCYICVLCGVTLYRRNPLWCELKRALPLMGATYCVARPHQRMKLTYISRSERPCFGPIETMEDAAKGCGFPSLMKWTKGRCPKKKRDFLGIFPKCRTPPPPPPLLGTTVSKKKSMVYFWSSSKCSLFGNYSEIYFWE